MASWVEVDRCRSSILEQDGPYGQPLGCFGSLDVPPVVPAQPQRFHNGSVSLPERHIWALVLFAVFHVDVGDPVRVLFHEPDRRQVDPALPRRLRVMADANFRAAVRRRQRRGANLHPRVGVPARDVAGIPGVEDDRARFEVQPVNIEERAIAEIQRDEQFAGEIRFRCHDAGASALKRRVIAPIARGEIDAVEVPVLIAVQVFQIHLSFNK
jgi:hypothetical protein